MIDQHTIATTQRYNFPQSIMNGAFSDHFAEQSLRSLENPYSTPTQLNQDEAQQFFNLKCSAHSGKLYMPSIALKARRIETTVGAVDTSCVRLGETSRGIIMAVRGTIVWKLCGSYSYTRFGPFVFHITEENRHEVFKVLARAYGDFALDRRHVPSPSLVQTPIRIASLLERMLQSVVAGTTRNGLVLFDGSLVAGTAEAPLAMMKNILDVARNQRNVVLAFSKMTTLRIGGRLITDLPGQDRPPFLLDVEELRPRPPQILLGKIYVAKLGVSSYSFRLDIDGEIPFKERILAVERLLANDIALQGYPETLRLAHILCTFTANEVLAMQHFAVRRYGIKLLCRPDMHTMLFGPYGKGEQFS